MAAPVYSSNLLEESDVTDGANVVPGPGHVFVIRDIYISLTNDVPVELAVLGGASNQLYADTLTTAGSSNTVWDRHIVVPYGNSLGITLSPLSTCDIGVYGYDLTLP